MEEQFFSTFKYFSISFDKLIEKKTGMTSAQLRILGYLMHNRDRHIYQKDIEETCGVSRAAVSAILDKMEYAGLLQRRNSELDRRMKYITLTESGWNAAIGVYNEMLSIEAELYAILNHEEVEILLSVRDKLFKKLEELGC